MNKLKTTKRVLGSALLAAVVTVVGVPTQAFADVGGNEDASGSAMFVDFLFLRPVGLIATVIGTATFVVTSPFSALGGNIRGAGATLVVEPVKYTFLRPLGDI